MIMTEMEELCTPPTTPRGCEYASAFSGTPQYIPSTPAKRFASTRSYISCRGESPGVSPVSSLASAQGDIYREHCRHNPFLNQPLGVAPRLTQRLQYPQCEVLHRRFVVSDAVSILEHGVRMLDVVGRCDGTPYKVIAQNAPMRVSEAIAKRAVLAKRVEAVAQYFDAWVEGGVLFMQVEAEAKGDSAEVPVEGVCEALEALHEEGYALYGAMTEKDVFVARNGAVKMLTPYTNLAALVNATENAEEADFDRAFELFCPEA